jgi:hypothetical protein
MVDGATTLDEANDALNAAGIRTELDFERAMSPVARSGLK